MRNLKRCYKVIILVLFVTLGTLMSANVGGIPHKIESDQPICTTILTIDSVYDQEKVFLNGKPEDYLYEALIFYGIKHPDIVYSQAILETGHFKSRGCVLKNNLFGLMRGKKLIKFDHWTESVKYYRDHIQNRYKGGDYYDFLKHIHYAESKTYNAKVRQIVQQTVKKRNQRHREDVKDDTIFLLAERTQP